MTTEQKEFEQRLFAIFLPDKDEDDTFRQWMNEPFVKSGYACATNSNILIFTKEPRDYKIVNRPPIERLIPLQDISIEISVSEFRKKLVPDMVYKKIDCDDCYGAGFKECNLGHEHECNGCFGNGVVNDLKSDKIPFPEKYFRFSKTIFAYKYLDKLLSACEMLNLDTIKGLTINPLGACLFELNETYKVIVMPVNTDHKKDTITDIELKK